MADYDCRNPRSTTSTAAVSTSQALPSSTGESMWEGWAQTSPTLTEQLQQQLGSGYSNCSTSTRNGSSYQHDLLSSWLMSGYQTLGLHQQQQHGEVEGSGLTTMYQDEFSRMNICSSSSPNYHGVAAPAAARDSDASHQLYDVMQIFSSNFHTGNDSGPSPTEVGQSAQFLSSPTSDHSVEAAHILDAANANQKLMQHKMIATELSSRASSSSPPSGLNPYGQTTQQHLEMQFDSSNYWGTTGSTAAVTSPPFKLSDCRGGGMISSGQLREDQQPNTSCDSIILHQQLQKSTKKGSAGNDGLFNNSGTDLTANQMYTELHGLFGKNAETPAIGDTAEHSHHQLAICSGGASSAAATYDDQSSWTQFTVSPSFCAPSSHGERFTGIQEVADRTMFDRITPDSLSTAAKHAATRKDDTSPSSASTAMSTIHNFSPAAGATAADLTHTTLPYRASSVDLDCQEVGLQRKRPLSRGTEQVGENGVTAEDSVKRSCIVRCLWEQNIAQLQLASLPSQEHQQNLWQLQSQALFGRLPSNFLIGGGSSSNSGSIDMNASVGPALNTNGRPRARRGSATDPQSVYARHRRERINDRLKVLQHLVPNGAKVDIVTMLEEAINYVKFLQLQVRLLSSDELWIYAPTTYNGVDVSMGVHAGLLNRKA